MPACNHKLIGQIIIKRFVFKEFLLKEIEKIDKDFKVTICGSYRRGLETSGDIDMLLTHPTYVSSSFVKENKATVGQKKNLIVDSKKSPKPLIDKVVNHLVQLKFITDTMAFGETKFMVTYYKRIDDKPLSTLSFIFCVYEGSVQFEGGTSF